MRPRPWLLPLAAVLAAAVACDLPGAAPRTPFVFPTPNETLTAVFAPTPTAPAVDVPSPTPPPTVAATVVTPVVAPPTATLGSLSSRPNGSVLEALHLASAPTIDGDLAEWASLPYASDRIVYGSSRWTGAGDVSAKFALGWDAAYLYLAVRVTDDKYVQVASGDDIWMGDEVEVQLDADLAGDYHTASISSDDHQLGLSAGNFGSLGPSAYRWYPQALRGSLSTSTVAGRLTSGGYDLEARIPWAVFSINPVEGARYGFALSVSDNDAVGVAAQHSMVSSVSTRKLLNPTTWGTLALGGMTPK